MIFQIIGILVIIFVALMFLGTFAHWGMIAWFEHYPDSLCWIIEKITFGKFKRVRLYSWQRSTWELDSNKDISAVSISFNKNRRVFAYSDPTVLFDKLELYPIDNTGFGIVKSMERVTNIQWWTRYE